MPCLSDFREVTIVVMLVQNLHLPQNNASRPKFSLTIHAFVRACYAACYDCMVVRSSGH